MNEAQQAGYDPTDPNWANLGQGQPEAETPGAPERIGAIEVATPDLEYAPVPGIRALQEAVADFLQSLIRKGRSSLLLHGRM